MESVTTERRILGCVRAVATNCTLRAACHVSRDEVVHSDRTLSQPHACREEKMRSEDNFLEATNQHFSFRNELVAFRSRSTRHKAQWYVHHFARFFSKSLAIGVV